MYEYNAKILRIVDGDTVEVELDLGFHIKYKNTVRLVRINTAELRAKDVDERNYAKQAKEFIASLLPVDSMVLVKSTSLDKYGRILGEIMVGDLNISDKMLAESMARPY